MTYLPLSPDGFPLDCEATHYPTRMQAGAAIRKWAERYKAQGYYRTADWDKIPVGDLLEYCSVVKQ